MDNEIGGLSKGMMDSAVGMNVGCGNSDSHFFLDPKKLSTKKRFDTFFGSLTNRSGNTMSLKQQGAQTAKNKNTKTTRYNDQLREFPVANRIWNSEAQVLSNTWPAWGNFVEGR
jgi:hypothetical protein